MESVISGDWRQDNLSFAKKGVTKKIFQKFVEENNWKLFIEIIGAAGESIQFEQIRFSAKPMKGYA